MVTLDARAPAAACGLLILLAAPAAAQYVSPANGGAVSIHATQAPLGAVLRDLARVIRFDRLSIDPGVEQTPVTVALDKVSAWAGLLQLLRAANVDYVFAVSASGNATRLAVTDLADGPPVRAAATPPPPPASAAPFVVERNEASPPAGAGPAHRADPQGPAIDTAEAEAEAQVRTQQMLQLLTMPRVPPAPGSLVELPFPAADGSPNFAIQPQPGAPVVLPVPPAPAPATGGTGTRPAPPPHDPRVRQLLDSLIPR